MNHNFVTFYIADKLNCTSDYSIWFAAFDLEEYQPSCSAVNCPCTGGLCGSGYFVQNFSRYLNSTGANFQGAFILETILNHNTTPHSQDLPSSIQSAFPQLERFSLDCRSKYTSQPKDVVKPKPKPKPIPIRQSSENRSIPDNLKQFFQRRLLGCDWSSQ